MSFNKVFTLLVLVASFTAWMFVSALNVAVGAELTWGQEMAQHINMVCSEENGVKLGAEDLVFLGFGTNPEGTDTVVYKAPVDSNCKLSVHYHLWARDLALFDEH